MISGMGALVNIAAKNKIEHIIFGMSHRGRLNTLYSIFRKPIKEIIGEFEEIL